MDIGSLLPCGHCCSSVSFLSCYGCIQEFMSSSLLVLTIFFLLMNTVLMTIGAQYGLGQNLMDILEEEPDHLPLSLLYEAASQTFAIIAMSIAKWSLGLFLLRLVKEKWHKIAIWCMMACLISASIAVCFVYWFQYTPPEYLWNRKIPGRCHIDTAPVSLTLCSES
ncbi:hypothetical protein SNK05_005394 [Fusarium graminearum]